MNPSELKIHALHGGHQRAGALSWGSLLLLGLWELPSQSVLSKNPLALPPPAASSVGPTLGEVTFRGCSQSGSGPPAPDKGKGGSLPRQQGGEGRASWPCPSPST